MLNMRPSLPVLFLFGTTKTHAFVPVRREKGLHALSSKCKSTSLASSFLKSIFPSSSPTESSSISPTFPLEAETIFGKCQTILGTDLCIRDPSLLSERFIYYGPFIDPLNKEEYIAAGKFFDLRQTFPDLDYRAHDFRIVQPALTTSTLTIRCTLRTVGTMQGALRLRDEVLPPNGKRMICPPEALTIELDTSSGLVLKICSGFVMDKLVGNCRGLCNVMAAATIAGAPPSNFEIYPPNQIVSRFFARTIKQLPLESSSSLAPFPETVMIQLAKGVIANDYGSKDLSLLGKDFSYYSPTVGPIVKDDFVKFMGKINPKVLFPNYTEELTNFRVDPYDPYRVWVDLRAKGTSVDGKKYESPSEAVSLTFDVDGFCTRITTGAVMDPTEGNTGGLGGTLGIQYSLGHVSPFTARPLPQIFSASLKTIVKPLTETDVIYKRFAKIKVESTLSVQEKNSKDDGEKPKAPSDVSTKILPSPPKEAPVLSLKNLPLLRKKESYPMKSSIKKAVQPAFILTSPTKVSPLILKAKSASSVSSIKQEVDNVKIEMKSVLKGSEVAAATKMIEVNKAGVKVGKMSPVKSELPKIQKVVVNSLFNKITSAPTVAKKESVAYKSPNSVENKKRVLGSEATKKSSSEQIGSISSDAKVSLFNIGKEKTVSVASKKEIIEPPKGIPVIKQWKIGKDRTISGSIYGSKGFKDGKEVTTSVITFGMIEKGSIVTTASGSKYFLA